MAINTLTVIPGYQLGATEELTTSIINLIAKPTVQATLEGPILDENYFRNGNMYSPYWTTPSGVSCPAGAQTSNAQYWYIQPNGSGNVNCLEDTNTPDLLSLYSMKLVGASGITDVLCFEQINSDLSATLRQVCTISGWIYNGTASPFTPTLQVAIANSIGNFATVTVAADLSFASCPAGQWTYVSLSQDLSVYSNVKNGLQLAIHIPTGVLNSGSNFVNLTRLKIQPGNVATTFADDISLFVSIPTVGTSNLQNQAVTAAKIANNTVGVGQLDPTCGICPTGSLVMFGNALSIPTGWLGCNGAAVSRATYANLFNALTIQPTASSSTSSPTLSGTGFTALFADYAATGNVVVGAPISGPGIATGSTILSYTNTTITLSLNATGNNTNVTYVIAPWGVGDASTTFNLPDMRGKVPVGHGTGTGLSARQVGQTGGQETHALTVAELASHNHTATDAGHNHSQNAHNHSDSGHSHTIGTSYGAQQGSGAGFTYIGGGATANSGSGNANNQATTATNQTGYASITVASNGSGTAHNIMQPFGVVLYIVKT